MRPGRVRVCSFPRCPERVTSGRCAKHGGGDNRPSSTVRGYGTEWRKLRLVVIAEEPVCTMCHKAPSQCVDHIVALRNGGTNDRKNLRGACLSCNTRKANREEGGYGNRKRPAA